MRQIVGLLALVSILVACGKGSVPWSVKDQSSFTLSCRDGYRETADQRSQSATQVCQCLLNIISHRWTAAEFNLNSVEYMNRLEQEKWFDTCERQAGFVN